MTKLKSFGCSFIYGDDLHDTFICDDPWSMYTWPALLAQDLNLKYECWAQSGSGNLQILDSLLTQLQQTQEPAIYVVAWTWIDRMDYTNPLTNSWSTIRPSNSDNVSNLYYKNFHSQYQDKLLSLTYINTAIQALRSQGHKFIMTYQDSLIFETDWHHSGSIGLLQQMIRPSLTTFEGMNFLEWSKFHGYKISAAWHPLEDAHQAAFEYIRDQRLV
jgi:hypothetical protein